jgi:hypothetical protein
MTNLTTRRIDDRASSSVFEMIMNAYAKQEEVNDCAHRSQQTQIMCESPGLPGQYTAQFLIRLTDSKMQVTQFDQSYIFIEYELTLQLNKQLFTQAQLTADDATRDALLDNQFVFVGFKGSAELIGRYQLYFGNTPIADSLQQYGTLEAFLQRVYTCESQLENKIACYSEWKYVQQKDDTVCGIYLPLSTFYDKTTKAPKTIVTVTFPIQYPYHNNLQLQGCWDYPNAILGDMKFSFTPNPNALVVCQVIPSSTISTGIENGTIDKGLPNLSNIRAIDPSTYNFTRQFTQIGHFFNADILMGWDGSAPKHNFVEDLQITCTGMRVTQLYAVASGYDVLPDALERVRAKLKKEPYVLMGQRVDKQVFSSAPSGGNVSAISTNTTIKMATCFYVLFPQHVSTETCFHQPQLTNFQLSVGNQVYPEVPTNTWGVDFATHQELISGFDGDSGFTMNDAIHDSWALPRAKANKILRPVRDATDFVFAAACQRRMGALLDCWDGVDTEGSNISVKLAGNSDPHNPVCYPSTDPQNVGGAKDSVVKSPPPIFVDLVMIKMVFWLNSSNVSQMAYYDNYPAMRAFTASVGDVH